MTTMNDPNDTRSPNRYHIDYKDLGHKIEWRVIDDEGFIRDERFNSSKDAETFRDKLNAQS